MDEARLRIRSGTGDTPDITQQKAADSGGVPVADWAGTGAAAGQVNTGRCRRCGRVLTVLPFGGVVGHLTDSLRRCKRKPCPGSALTPDPRQ